MEFVGVRNITAQVSNFQSGTGYINFEVDSNHIMKILNVTTNLPLINSSGDWLVTLDNQIIIDHDYGYSRTIKTNFPFYITEGSHQLSITDSNLGGSYTTILYGLEFKLTAP